MRRAKKECGDTTELECRQYRPATTPEAVENQMISLATDLARQQFIDGTASSQVITHYLKLGTEQSRLERKKLEYEIELVKAKTEATIAQRNMTESYDEVLKALHLYQTGEDDCSEVEYND